MERKLYALHALLLFGLTMMVNNINALQPRRVVAKETPAMQVNKEVSTLDQIVAQAKMIVNASGGNEHKIRATSKKQIKKLMKELDPRVKNAIQEPISTILEATAENRNKTKNAYDKLIATANIINSQADVIAIMEEGQKMIKQAPNEMKDQVIAQSVQNVQAAQEKTEEASMMGQMIGGVKGVLAAPGNYIFGEERTAAKTAFETVVGALVTGGAAYLAYTYAPEETRAKLGEYYSKAQEALSFKKAAPSESTTQKPQKPQKPSSQAISEEPEMSDYAKYTTGNMTPEEELEYLSEIQRELEWKAAATPQKTFRERATELIAPYIEKGQEKTAPYIEEAKKKWEKFREPSKNPIIIDELDKPSTMSQEQKSQYDIAELYKLASPELQALFKAEQQLIKEGKQNTDEFKENQKAKQNLLAERQAALKEKDQSSASSKTGFIPEIPQQTSKTDASTKFLSPKERSDIGNEINKIKQEIRSLNNKRTQLVRSGTQKNQTEIIEINKALQTKRDILGRLAKLFNQ